MNIEESNKIIAEFVGFKFSEHFGGFMTESGNVQFYKANYHKSWSRLMPVIEKIESLGYKFQLCRHRAQICLDDGFNTPALCDYKGETKIQAAYVAVVNFIKNYKP